MIDQLLNLLAEVALVLSICEIHILNLVQKLMKFGPLLFMLFSHWHEELLGILLYSLRVFIPNLDVVLEVLHEGLIFCRRVFNPLHQNANHAYDQSSQLMGHIISIILPNPELYEGFFPVLPEVFSYPWLLAIYLILILGLLGYLYFFHFER